MIEDQSDGRDSCLGVKKLCHIHILGDSLTFEFYRYPAISLQRDRFAKFHQLPTMSPGPVSNSLDPIFLQYLPWSLKTTIEGACSCFAADFFEIS